jgi:hypothetical protein
MKPAKIASTSFPLKHGLEAKGEEVREGGRWEN